VSRVKITILSENSSATTTSLSEWGWSAYIEYDGSKILFDTGMSGDVVVKNAKSLKIDLTAVETIILSHGHYDHCDGLERVIKEVGRCDIFCHENILEPKFTVSEIRKKFSGVKFKQGEIENLGGRFKFLDSTTEIFKGVHLIADVSPLNSFEMIPESFILRVDNQDIKDSFRDEINLAIDLGDSLIAMSGCAHLGIVNILEHIKKLREKRVTHFFGGTHLKDASTKRINETIDYLTKQNLKLLAPAHCTGFDALVKIQNGLGEIVTPAFCGLSFNIS
jgi:7,8-dihydropterin-6-yl-methyl-4-(beta-D-ribofuranosyl)aminobenzene 5'-phosphate synthase